MKNLEYNFIKIDSKNCNPRSDSEFDTLEEAENECKHNKQCKAVLDHGCNQQQSFLCLREDETTGNEDEKRSIDDIESCVYEKFAIGVYHLEYIRFIFLIVLF